MTQNPTIRVPPSLTILIPLFNEESTLPSLMTRVSTACPDAQIIFINDGSTDTSWGLLQKHKNPQDKIMTQDHAGKGVAIQYGLTAAEGTYTIIQDADLEYDPNHIPLLLQRAMENPGTAVFGSRFLQPNPNLYKRFLLGNKCMTAVLNILFGGHLTDSYTCFKLLPTELFRSLQLSSQGFELEAEISAKCLRRGTKIIEVPIAYKPRSIREGKKIGWKDAWLGLATMLHIWVKSR